MLTSMVPIECLKINPLGADTLKSNKEKTKNQIYFFCLTAAQRKYCHTFAWTCGGETTTEVRREWKKGRERESIQFNNKDVHLNKRINEAKNSMKCDAIHRTLDFYANSFTPRSRVQAMLNIKKDRSSLWCNAT